MTNRNFAAILCTHVVNNHHPILLAIRTEPEDDMDSGWQFLCNSVMEEDWQTSQVWSISEVLELEPSIESYIDSPPGTTIFRDSNDSDWCVQTELASPRDS